MEDFSINRLCSLPEDDSSLILSGGEDRMRKRLLVIVSVALASFLMGTTFSAVAFDTESPFAKIWQAINNLQGRVENLEESANGESEVAEFIDEISRVEFLEMEYWNWSGPRYYDYGVSGHWNISKIQTEPINDKLLSTLGGEDGSIAVLTFSVNAFQNRGL